MQNEPLWLDADFIIRANQMAVAATGEPHFLRDANLLQSAVERPRWHYYYGGEDDVLCLATSLLFGICQNHPFEQGNKRTGFIAAVAFLDLNGYMLTVADTALIGEFVLQVINGDMTEAQFVLTMDTFVAPKADYEDEDR